MSDIRKYIELLENAERIEEARVEDVYPKQFNAFMQKYKSVKGNRFYVQFTDHKNNTIDKSAFRNPDNHSDFVGVYGYPLKYVVKHPMDVWYGNNARYLRVIEANTDTHVLDFTSMPKSTAIMILNKFPTTFFRNTGFSRDTLLDDIAKIMEYTGRNRWGRALLAVIQHELINGAVKDEPRSGSEQTNIVRQLGYDVIVDRATSHNTATINDREPEQIIFLARNTFKVIDIFQLHDNENSSTATASKDVDESFLRKLASVLAAAIGTKLSDTLKDGLRYIGWTKRGDQIELVHIHSTSSFDATKNGMDIKLGQKPHRYYTNYDGNTVEIKIKSIKGEINTTLEQNSTIKQVAQSLRNTFDGMNELEFSTPHDKHTYQQSKEQEVKRRPDPDKDRSMKMYDNTLGPLIAYYGMTDLESYGENNGHKMYDLLRKFFESSDMDTFNTYISMAVEKVENSSSNLVKKIALKDVDLDKIESIKELVKLLEKDGLRKSKNLYDSLVKIKVSKMDNT